MLISTNVFLFFFLPIVICFTFLLKIRYRNAILLFFSLVFYAWGETQYVFLMLVSIVLNYLFGLLIERVRDRQPAMRTVLVMALVYNVGTLFLFKYLNFTILNLNKVLDLSLPLSELALPVGISFFTFKAISYCIDVYRGVVTAEKNILHVGLYISFFPQLMAGPIARYDSMMEQLHHPSVTFNNFSIGVKRFLIGLAKKVILADTLATVAAQAFAVTDPGALSVSFAWMGAIAYTLQIFLDFSGYSDMAIGLGQMLGFHTKENFDYPYISKSISEFWRRWHISLGSWFRDYVYFSLGGSHVSTKTRLVFNLFVVWLLTGLWHGANWTFIVWGLMYFVLISFEKIYGYPEKFNSEFAKTIYRIFTLLCVMGGWVIFNAASISHAAGYFASMLALNGNAWFDAKTVLYLHETWLFLLVSILLSMPLLDWLKGRLAKRPVLFKAAAVLMPWWYLFLFLLSVSYIEVGSHNPFIYFNF